MSDRLITLFSTQLGLSAVKAKETVSNKKLATQLEKVVGLVSSSND